MVAGYCWPQSLQHKDTVRVFCHSETPRVSIQVVRQGAEDQLVFEQTHVAVQAQMPTEDVATSGCGWQPCAELTVDPAWPSGFYLVRLSDDHGAKAEAFFVVRAPRPQHALLVLATSTWAAYNNWGGPSFYTGGHTSSLMRPLPAGFLHKTDPHQHRVARYVDWSKDDAKAFADAGYSPWCMAAGWANWELLFVRWAESRGLQLGYATSADLDQDGDLLSGYPAYLSVGHDEYWSQGMRDNVESFVDDGGNAAFFSGNTSFWQARFENEHSQLVCYKTALEEDPWFDPAHAPNLSTMWSDPLVSRPEDSMTGVSFTRGGYAHMPNAPRGTGGYQIWQPDHWAFEGLGLLSGASLGADGIVVGYECDGCELIGHDDGTLHALRGSITPEGLAVLATAPARLWETHEAVGDLDESYIGELNWVAERLGGADTPGNRERFADGHAVMGTFRRGRGQVFTTGCTDWAYGLTQNDVATVTRNVLAEFVGPKFR